MDKAKTIIEELNRYWKDSPDGGYDQALKFLADCAGSYPEEYLKILEVEALQRIANALAKGGAGDALLHDKSSQKA